MQMKMMHVAYCFKCCFDHNILKDSTSVKHWHNYLPFCVPTSSVILGLPESFTALTVSPKCSILICGTSSSVDQSTSLEKLHMAYW